MVRLLLLIPLLLSTAGAATLAEDYGNLEGVWRFQTDPAEVGERDGWAAPAFDDSGWRTLVVPGYWEPQGVTAARPGQPPRPTTPTLRWTDYDGVAWYRLRFTVPVDWAGRPLLLRLGSVDDQDRTFLNGQLIGETGAGVKNPVSIPRRYAVPPEAVRFGAENVLALRVTDGGGPGGLMGPEVSLLPRLEGTPMVPSDDRPLVERFANPPGRARILKIVHNLPDQPEAQAELLDSLIRQGFGGMVTNVSFTDYLRSDAKWEAFLQTVTQAKARGMALWLYDEKGYPSGTAGGLTLAEHPEWEARGLLCAEAESTGGPVDLDLPPGRLVLAAAYPLRDGQLDLAGALPLGDSVRDGKLTWQAPPGVWRVLAVTEDRLYEGTHAAISLSEHQPYINLLQPQPTARFVELTHAAYAARMGDNLGQYFLATFTDEPSLMSVFFRPMPYRPLPASPELTQRFAARHGRPLAEALPGLLGPTAGAAKVRYDFWQSVAELVADSYFGQIERWCAAHGLPSGGHLLAEESLVGHVPLYGDFYRCIRELGAPSIDCLTSLPAQVPWRIAKLIGSVADLTGRPITMCETSDHSQRYRAPGDERPAQQVSEAEIRGTCNRLILGGINTITSYYSFSGLSSEQLRKIN
ncbi:MAG: hypothetical protein HUU35_09810, partial [Armatimonadetes bacterium]|nr:hypothetical protein [Armatimonadota bacterium]